MRSLAIILVLLFSASCFGQDQLQFNGRSSPYIRYSDRYGSFRAYAGGSSYSFRRTYLGEMNSNRYDPNSISNPYGRYGSQYSFDSINNVYGPFGAYSTSTIYVYPKQ